MSYPYPGGNPGYPQGGGYAPPQPGGYPQPGGPGYPQPGGGYPQQGGPPGGYPQPGGGYPQPGGPPGGYQAYPQAQQPPQQPQIAMPSAESASAAAYGAPGGMPYSSQPSGPGGLGFDMGGGSAPPPQQGYGAPQPGYGAPPAQQGYGAPPQQQGYGAPPPVAMPSSYNAPQPTYQAQGPGYGSSPAYNTPQPAPGGYGQGPQPGAPQPGQYSGSAPGGYGAAAPSAPGQPPARPAQQPQYGGYQGQASGGVTAQSTNAAAGYKVKETGTIRPYPNFNAETDAGVLRKAMKGFGTDEKAIIDILAFRSNDQRMQIKLMYKTMFGRDLINDLKSELSSRFEDCIVALMYKPDEYDALELKRAMRGLGTDEGALIEILCTRSSKQIQQINATYKTMFHRTLEQELVSETSGHFKRLVVSMSAGGRQENQPVDMNKANADAQRLYQAGEKRWGTDESAFNAILASQSYEQLRAVFESYKTTSGKDIEQAVKSEMSGDLCTGMLAIIRSVRSRSAYFAERLYKSMKGAGTDDRTLIRIIVTRCEVDMVQIKQDFQRLYGKSLDGFIRDDTSGDYRKLLCAIVAQGGY